MNDRLLNERYRISHLIGKGGYSEIFIATDLAAENKQCVIKKLQKVAHDSQLQRRLETLFAREARILAKLRGKHPQIPDFYDYFTYEGEFYLVQEWIQGMTLQQTLKREIKLSESVTKKIISDLLLVLESIHDLGIIHRDIKPSNIILRSHDLVPVLIDFGVAKEISENIINQDDVKFSRVGTPGYMSLEQAMGKADCRSDLYSLSLIAIYLLTGKSPHNLNLDSTSQSNFWHHEKNNFNPELVTVLERGLGFANSQRFVSAKAMRLALQSPSQTRYLDSKKSRKNKSKLESNKHSQLPTLLAILGAEIIIFSLSLNFFLPSKNYRSTTSYDIWESWNFESPLPIPTYNPDNSIFLGNPENSLNLPVFTTGTSEMKILEVLGEPVWRRKGYWSNSIAWAYKNVASEGIDIGYLFDTRTKKLRQTEIAVPSATELAVLQNTLDGLLPFDNKNMVMAKLEQVYRRETATQNFAIGNLEGVIQRNQQDRIYIGVWEADFH